MTNIAFTRLPRIANPSAKRKYTHRPTPLATLKSSQPSCPFGLIIIMAISSQDRLPFHIYTAKQRPDLLKTLDKPDHPLNLLWPDFLDEDLTFKEFIPKLAHIESLKRFQFLAIEEDPFTGEEQVIGLARSIPFYWRELSALGPKDFLLDHPKILDTLPDGGYDTILSLGVRQALARQATFGSKGPTIEEQQYTATDCSSHPPNALSALSISVQKDRRKTGLAEIFIRRLKQTAIDENYRAMVVPLRPTQKPSHPFIEMAEYITWMGNASDVTCLDLDSAQKCLHTIQGQQQPHVFHFDPWLRKHLRLGGRIVKVAPTSMMVQGTPKQWAQWTGVDFDPQKLEQDPAYLHSNYVNVVIPGGLVPVRYHKKEKIGVYIEPNVWVFHELGG